MPNVLVAGLINVETTLRIDSFPLSYFPVCYPFHGVRSTISGVGLNVALALNALGDSVHLLSLLGADPMGDLAESEIRRRGISSEDVLRNLSQTPQSVVLYDPDGRRQIHVDLKDAQERAYPDASARRLLPRCNLAVLCNVGFARNLLPAARDTHVPVATDVHALSDPDDDYNRDFMAAARILFLSNERFQGREREMLDALLDRYPPEIAVCGMGRHGALLVRRDGERRQWHHQPALSTRPVVNTIGAGDALFSAFNHFLAQGRPPEESLRLAAAFASWKIGETGAAEGFLAEPDVAAQAAAAIPVPPA